MSRSQSALILSCFVRLLVIAFVLAVFFPLSTAYAQTPNLIYNRLTANPGEDIEPAWDPRGSTVAYARSYDGDNVGAPRSIWKVQSDATGEQLLVKYDSSAYVSSYWLGDSLTWQGSTGQIGMHSNTSQQKYLTFNTTTAPLPYVYNGSPTTIGQNPYFTRKTKVGPFRHGGTWRFSRDGTMAVVRISNPTQDGLNPSACAPGECQIYRDYYTGRELARYLQRVHFRVGTVASMTGQFTSVYSGANFGTPVLEHMYAHIYSYKRGVAITPNGSAIIVAVPVSADGNNNGPHDLKLFPVGQGTNPAPLQLTNDAANGCINAMPDVSPDGTVVVYSKQCPGGTWDLWQVNIDGSDPRQITNTADFHEYAPTIAPDTQMIAFQGMHTGSTVEDYCLNDTPVPPLPASESPNWNIYTIREDSGQTAGEGAPEVCSNDCNDNDIPDICDVNPDASPSVCSALCVGASCGTAEDCNGDYTPDSCQLEGGDSDGDGVLDACDGCPDDSNKVDPGTCGCGVADTDSDGDNTLDCEDGCPDDSNKVDPGTCGCGVADTDSDGDNTLDCEDGCPNDGNKVVPGACGCGVADTDSDGDNTPDCEDGCPNDANKLSPGTCGCGVADTDSDGDNTLDCEDGCPNDGEKLTPGACGCGVPDTDSDGDNTPDCQDECPNDSDKTSAGICGCGESDTADNDQDNSPDCVDECDNNPQKTEAGDCGCSIPDTDLDNSGTADCSEDCNNNDIADVCDVNPLIDANLCEHYCGSLDGQSRVEQIVVEVGACGTASDCNGNLTPDSCEVDSDEDEFIDSCDNCVEIPNPGQEDADDDGAGDACDQCPEDSLKTEPGACGCGTADTDSDDDGTADCSDLCPDDKEKTAPGVCGCGFADVDENDDGTLDCIEEPQSCAGTCDTETPDLDEDGDGVSNCQELSDGTAACDPGSFIERLEPSACAGPNGYFQQVNVATVLNHQQNKDLFVQVDYRDLLGVEQGSVSKVLAPNEKWDVIVNELGLAPDSYGTVCVHTDAEQAGAWSGGLAIYKERNFGGLAALSAGSIFDFALYYPFTNPKTGRSTVSLNTNTINGAGAIADWVRLTDAAQGDGKGLSGELRFFNSKGELLRSIFVAIPDGGRFDFAAHEVLGANEIGLAEFIPAQSDIPYYIESSRYHYEGQLSAAQPSFFTAYTVPVRPLTGAEITGRISAGVDELVIVEIVNGGDADAMATYNAFNGGGENVRNEALFVPAKGAVHKYVGSALLQGVGGTQVGSVSVSGASPTFAATTVVYAFGSPFKFAYAPPLVESAGMLQLTEHNTFLGHKNTLVLSNSSTETIKNIMVKVFDFKTALLQEHAVDLDGKATQAIELSGLPADIYGAIKVEAPVPGVVILNKVSRANEYILTYPGR